MQEHLLRQPYVPCNVHMMRWIEDNVGAQMVSYVIYQLYWCGVIKLLTGTQNVNVGEYNEVYVKRNDSWPGWMATMTRVSLCAIEVPPLVR